jgi:hypothetical protein
VNDDNVESDDDNDDDDDDDVDDSADDDSEPLDEVALNDMRDADDEKALMLPDKVRELGSKSKANQVCLVCGMCCV